MYHTCLCFILIIICSNDLFTSSNKCLPCFLIMKVFDLFKWPFYLFNFSYMFVFHLNCHLFKWPFYLFKKGISLFKWLFYLFNVSYMFMFHINCHLFKWSFYLFKTRLTLFKWSFYLFKREFLLLEKTFHFFKIWCKICP